MENQKRSGLAEQIFHLSNPKPAAFHPDEELLGEETAAKVCDFTYESGNDSVSVRLPSAAGVQRARAKKGIELNDPKYAGKVVDRKELEFNGELPW